MSQPVVFGAAYSVYVRTVRLTLAEKDVPYRLVEVDVFAEGGPPREHFARHPFGRIPAFAVPVHGSRSAAREGGVVADQQAPAWFVLLDLREMSNSCSTHCPAANREELRASGGRPEPASRRESRRLQFRLHPHSTAGMQE